MQHAIVISAATTGLFLAMAVFGANGVAVVFGGVYWLVMFDSIKFMQREQCDDSSQ